MIRYLKLHARVRGIIALIPFATGLMNILGGTVESTYTVQQIRNQILFEKGLTIINPDTMLMSKIVGIEVESSQLRNTDKLDDDAKLELKMELVQRFHSRLDSLF